MGLKTVDIVATLAINLIQYACSDHILACNVTAWAPCPGDNQICNQTSATASECVCMKGYLRVGDDCEAQNNSPSNGATAAIVTIFTVALVICGLVLVVRKYNLVDYVRQKIIMRRNNDVMYEDVMIGNDDPPLSP